MGVSGGKLMMSESYESYERCKMAAVLAGIKVERENFFELLVGKDGGRFERAESMGCTC